MSEEGIINPEILVRETIERDSMSLECPDCGQDVAWGNLGPHRRGGLAGCKESRLNFTDSDD